MVIIQSERYDVILPSLSEDEVGELLDHVKVMMESRPLARPRLRLKEERDRNCSCVRETESAE